MVMVLSAPITPHREHVRSSAEYWCLDHQPALLRDLLCLRPQGSQQRHQIAS